MILFDAFLSEQLQHSRDYRNKLFNRMDACDFDPLKTKWTDMAKFKSKSWIDWSLFDIDPVKRGTPIDEDHAVISPCKLWAYRNLILPKGETLEWHSQNGKVYSTRRGWSHGWNERRPDTGIIVFDDDITIPVIYERTQPSESFHTLWMSITPNELITLRPGFRYTKGHTVIAGLGLGWSAVMIAKRKQVERITIVEKSESLAKWLWPHIAKRLTCDELNKINIEYGDAWEVLPRLAADNAYIDIYEGTGYNHEDEEKWQEKCPDIKSFWIWG